MSKDIINYNSKGKRHGYNEWYYYNGKLWVKRFFNNNIPIDYEEFYYSDGKFFYKGFYI